jgi:Rhodopirellula transposase DDE domain
LLLELGYSLRANVKNAPARGHVDRDEQFHYIAAYKQAFQAIEQLVISVDAKKAELIGNFKNGGRAWRKDDDLVDVHDFPQEAVGRAIPYGMYDLTHNRGWVYVGTSANTPHFAVDAIAAWWQEDGQALFPRTTDLLILADGGGSNASRSRVWKQQLHDWCDRVGVRVTVCHYPPGCSKWNAIEHRMFSAISLNWAGQPLRSFAVLLGYLRGTTTTSGLTIKATLVEKVYAAGQRVSDQEMQQLCLEPHTICPK